MFSTRLYLHILLYVAAILLVSGLGVAGILSGRAVIFGMLAIVAALALASALVAHVGAYNRRIRFMLDAIGEDEATFPLAPHAATKEQRALLAAINRLSRLMAEQKRREFERELNQKEYESWKKLMRVLTHEIMNSIAPIVSLSDTLLTYFVNWDVDGSAAGISPTSMTKAMRALHTINDQAQALLHFTESCRQLSGLRQPRCANCSLTKLMQRLLTLYQEDFRRLGIKAALRFPKQEVLVCADAEMLSQVFVNLLKNAMQALQQRQEGRGIIIEAGRKGGSVIVSITDNGPGIPPEIAGDIFIPFFTIKPGGSGIGLSLSRQIVRMHGGDLSVTSQPLKATTFTVSLPVDKEADNGGTWVSE